MPDVWTLIVYSLLLYPIEAEPASRAYDELLDARVEIATACAVATDDQFERFTCMKVARFESSYRPDVARCDVRGSAGEVTAWQIIPRSKGEVDRLCSSLAEGARAHVALARQSRQACRAYPRADQLAVYTRGSCTSAEGRRLSRHRYPDPHELRRLEELMR